MGKWFVWIWAIGVTSVLGGMYLFLKQAARLAPHPMPAISLAAPEGAQGGGGGATGAAGGAGADGKAPAGSKLVQPEELPQGFIVVVTDKSKTASAGSPIHMPSSHNGWNPSDPGMKLEPQSDMKWRIEWSKPKLDSRVAFKFARGSWDAVEVDKDYKDVENRMLPPVDVSKLAPGEKPVIEFTVEGWKDRTPGGPRTAGMERYAPVKVGAGSVRRVEVVGGGVPGLSRDVLVWLPPGYDDAANAERRYPVLYMMDGQNVFEQAPGVPGEWKADETAGALIGAGKIEPLIIVAVPHAGAKRAQEYLTYAMVDGVTPRGAEFVEFLVSEVKPKIDRGFRTKGDAAGTGVGGASLGGSIALDAGMLRPDVFGKVLAESVPLTNAKQAAFGHFAKAKAWPARVWMGVGGREMPKDPGASEGLTGSATAFGELARGRGLGADRFKLMIDPDAEHTESAWAKRLGPALEFLFPAGS